MNHLKKLIAERKGDLEEVRISQFDYNKAVRVAHREILDLKY